jgi:hypothetical protein
MHAPLRAGQAMCDDALHRSLPYTCPPAGGCQKPKYFPEQQASLLQVCVSRFFYKKTGMCLSFRKQLELSYLLFWGLYLKFVEIFYVIQTYV